MEIVWSRYFSPNYSPDDRAVARSALCAPPPNKTPPSLPGQEWMRRRYFSLNIKLSAQWRFLQHRRAPLCLSAGGATGLGRHPGGLVEKGARTGVLLREVGGAGGRDGGRVGGTPPQPDWRHPPPTDQRRALTFESGWEKVGCCSHEVLGAMPCATEGKRTEQQC